MLAAWHHTPARVRRLRVSGTQAHGQQRRASDMGTDRHPREGRVQARMAASTGHRCEQRHVFAIVNELANVACSFFTIVHDVSLAEAGPAIAVSRPPAVLPPGAGLGAACTAVIRREVVHYRKFRPAHAPASRTIAKTVRPLAVPGAKARANRGQPRPPAATRAPGAARMCA